MVVVLLVPVLIVGVLVHRRIRKRRARKRAIKLATVARSFSSPVARDAADEVIIIGRESISGHPSSPPPYSRPSPHPYESLEGAPHATVPGFEYPGTYARDKPPPYSAPAFQVQNS